MRLTDLTIEPKGEKGRAFTAKMVAFVRADALWREGGGRGDNTVRPVWAMLAGSQDELRPFMANLRMGRPAASGRHRKFEFIKSVRWRVIHQREPEGVLATIYHPDLFEPDPGMVDPDRIDFVVMVDQEWASAQVCDHERARAYMAKVGLDDRALEYLPLAPLVALYLDRRTRCPIVNDELFYFHVLVNALACGIAHKVQEGGRYLPYGTAFGAGQEGLDNLAATAVVWSCDHLRFGEFLAEQVTTFYALGV
jgi:hypothetical protein